MTPERARLLLLRGDAERISDTVVRISEVEHQRQILRAVARDAAERSIRWCRDLVTFWNGRDRDPLAMRRPGEVRS